MAKVGNLRIKKKISLLNTFCSKSCVELNKCMVGHFFCDTLLKQLFPAEEIVRHFVVPCKCTLPSQPSQQFIFIKEVRTILYKKLRYSTLLLYNKNYDGRFKLRGFKDLIPTVLFLRYNILNDWVKRKKVLRFTGS